MATILIISPSKVLKENIRLTFPKGMEVVEADSGQDALFFINTAWDLICLDLNLADMDSLEVLQKIKRANITADVIVFASQPSPEKCIAAMKLGACNYLTYPFNKSVLAALAKGIFENAENIRIIENLAHDVFGQIKDRMGLLKELIKIRSERGHFVTGEELLAFFPLHQRQELKNGILEKSFSLEVLKNLKKTIPPTILIVEDEPVSRLNLKRMLYDCGFEVHEAADAESALVIAKKQAKLDLMLLDIGLPGKSGLELLPLLHDLHPEAETIMLTAFSGQLDYIVEAFHNHTFDYLGKPYEKNELLLKISMALQKQCFRKLIPDLGKHILSTSLPDKIKFKILADVAKKRMGRRAHLLMKDLYLFFPELEAAQINRNKAISEEILDDGLGLFVEVLRSELIKKHDCKSLIENWERFFETA
ncbi:MAG: response regulator [Candidatus Margulisiibacteriota bacterium]